MASVATQPSRAQIGPLALTQYSTLPKRSRECFTKFAGDKIPDPEHHIKAFIVACGILGVQEHVLVRLFVESLIRNVPKRFQNLKYGCTTTGMI